jgi:hypothetical protein
MNRQLNHIGIQSLLP